MNSRFVKTQRTKNNEIFRTLFYVIDGGEKKHQYYIDHKLSGLLDEDTAFSLEVGSVREWNGQPETNNDSQFENKIISYLKGFNVCELPPVIICNKEDNAWINVIMKRLDFLSEKPLSIEELVKRGLGLEIGEIDSQIKIEAKNMFLDIEKIFTIWKILN